MSCLGLMLFFYSLDRVRLYDEVFSIVGEVRREAMEAMKKFTPRTAEKGQYLVKTNQCDFVIYSFVLRYQESIKPNAVESPELQLEHMHCN